MSGASEDRLLLGEWRIVFEALIGENFRACRVVDRKEADLIYKVNLFHRFAKPQAEIAFF